MPWPFYLHLYVTIPFLLIYWYVGTRLTDALVNVFQFRRQRIRTVLFVIAGWMISVPLILVIGYSINKTWALDITLGKNRLFDYLLLYPFWAGIICAAELGIAFLCFDIIKIFILRLFRKSGERWIRIYRITMLALAVLVLFYVALTIIRDTSSVRVSIKEYTIPGLSKSLDGFRILHVTDLHVDDRTRGGIFDDAIRKIKALHPDLAIFTGDLVTGETRYIEKGAQIIGEMETRYGTYACYGNHDAWVGKEKVGGALRRKGVIILEDTTVILRVGMSTIGIFGINNFYGDRAASSIFSRRGGDSVDFRILITHSAAHWLVDSASAYNYNLFLAGHTHGGQVAPGFPWWPVVMSRIETPYVSGFYTIGSMLVSISNGIGLTVAPLRFQAPAEITVIILRRG